MSNHDAEYVVISNFGARRALNFIIDLAKGRKVAVTFIRDTETGNIVETHTRKEIEVERRIKKQNNYSSKN
jgi:hypothetical protein